MYKAPIIFIAVMLLFTANYSTNGIELCVTDGTADSTYKIKPATATRSNPMAYTALKQLGNSLYFFAWYNNVVGTALWKLTTSGTTAVETVSEEYVTMYPNTVANRLLNITTPHTKKLQLFDLNGRVLLESIIDKGSNTIHLPHIAKGIYFVRVGETVKRIVVLEM